MIASVLFSFLGEQDEAPGRALLFHPDQDLPNRSTISQLIKRQDHCTQNILQETVVKREDACMSNAINTQLMVEKKYESKMCAKRFPQHVTCVLSHLFANGH